MQTVYETLLEWTSSAAIHNKSDPDIIFRDYSSTFPEQLQPLSLFIFEQQDVVKSTTALQELKSWILLQELYHYCHYLSIDKAQVIVGACAGIIADEYTVSFNDEQKRIASSIITDEGYHSYLCFSIKEQLAKLSKLSFIHVPDNRTLVGRIIDDCKQSISKNLINDFKLIVAALVKAVMVKEVEIGLEVISLSSQPGMIYELLQRKRQNDEIRHSCFFLYVVELLWVHLPSDSRSELISAISQFATAYKQVLLVNDEEYIARLLLPLSVDRGMLDQALTYIKNYRQDYAETIYTAMLGFLNQNKVLS